MSGTAASSLGLPSKRNRNKKSNKKSTLRVVVEILIVLTCVEFYAYRKLSKMEYDELERIYSGVDGDAGSNGNSNQQETARLVSPEVDRKKRQVDQRNQRKKIREMNRATKEKRVDDKKKGQKFNLTIDIQGASDEEVADRLKTADKLKHMGISGDVNLSELPLWSQIVENFNSYSNDDEPVIVGMEYCEAFREKTDKRFIGVGPAGMFSTGTNLIASLTRKNCMGPNDRVQKFALVQTPVRDTIAKLQNCKTFHKTVDENFGHSVGYDSLTTTGLASSDFDSTENTTPPMQDFITRSSIHMFTTGMLFCQWWPSDILIRGCRPCASIHIGELQYNKNSEIENDTTCRRN